MAKLLLDAWRVFRREADLIVRVVAPLVFLPALATQLIADPLPSLPETRDRGAMVAWFDAVTVWGQANAGWYLLADAIGVYGLAVVAFLLCDPARPDVASALGRAARLFPRLALASILVAIPVGLGMWLIILPGLFMQARLVAVVPVLAAEQPVGAAQSLGRSWRVTGGAGFALFSAVVTLFLLQWIAITPLASLDIWLRSPTHLNPFLLVLVEAALAVVGTAYHVGILLLGVVAYRRAASIGT